MFYSYHYAYENLDDSGWEGYEDYPIAEPYSNYTHQENDWKKKQEHLPCWSLGALFEVWKVCLRVEFHLRTNKNWNLFAVVKGHWLKSEIFNSLDRTHEGYSSQLEAIYDLVVWLLENHYICPKKPD